MRCEAIKSLERVENVVSFIRKRSLMYAIDLETTSVDPYTGSIVGIGMSVDASGGFYIPIRHRYDQPFNGAKAVALLRSLLTDYQFCAFNATFELDFLEHDWNLIPNVAPIDTSLLSYTFGMWDFQKLSLVAKDLCPDIEVGDFSKFMVNMGFNPNKNTIDEVPVDKVADYCVRDTTACMVIYKKLFERLRNHPIFKLESAVLPVVRRMRANGIILSEERVKAEEARLQDELNKLQKLVESQISEKVGEPIEFNIGSSKQLGNVLYDILGFSCEQYTEKGARKTDKATLGNLKWQHPIVRNIITHKEIKKLLTTYYSNYLKYVGADGRIHASWNQTGVVTGRFSCNDPNLQNIPRPNAWEVLAKGGNYKVEANFRDCFVAPEGWWFVEFDYSQIEARLMAGVTKDPVLVNTFANGLDYHTKTASEVFDTPIDKVDKDKRYMGKLLNFALGYGMGENLLYFTLRKDMDVTFDQTCYMRKKYIHTYKKMFAVAEEIAVQARKEKRILTLWNRQVPINLYYQAAEFAHCKTDDDRKKHHKLLADADRMAYNAKIQGSGADLLKKALYSCDKLISKKYPDSVQMLSTVHDSIGFYVRKDVNLMEFTSDILRCMFHQEPGFPPFFAEVSVGDSWGSLKEPGKGQTMESFVQQIETSTKEKQEGVVTDSNVFILEIPEGASKSVGEINSLRKLLKENPGENRVIVKEGETEFEIPFLTSLGLKEKEKITFIFGGKFYERLRD